MNYIHFIVDGQISIFDKMQSNNMHFVGGLMLNVFYYNDFSKYF